MRLTDRQERAVERAVEAVSRALAQRADITAAARERAVARLRGRIEGSLARFGAGVTDGQIEGVLAEYADADAAAAALVSAERFSASRSGDLGDPRWLGVCLHFAERSGLPPWVYRAVFAAAGLLVAPAALSVYGAAYLFLRATGAFQEEQPRIRWFRMAGWALLAVAVCAVLHTAAGYALLGVEWAVREGLKQEMPPLGGWGWFVEERALLLTGTLACALPAFVLGGLPMVNGWDGTLRRCGQAVLALYAVAVSFGLASVVAGVAVGWVRGLAG